MQTLVPTPLGDARITRFPAAGTRRAVLMLGHGAGGGVEAPDLRALAVALPAGGHGFAVTKSQTPVLEDITRAVAEWIDSLLLG